MPETASTGRTIAFIGLGNMGRPMARRLLESGHRVLGVDPVPEAGTYLSSLGGEPREYAHEAAREADTVILMLPDSSVVDGVITDLLTRGALCQDSVVIDMSSSEPQRSKANAERLEAAGVSFLDAPVSGGVRGAEGGSLTVMVGGEAETLAEVKSVLETLGTIRHVGPAGAGHAVKALNNMVSATHLWITSEAISLAGRFGVEAPKVLEVLNGSSGRSGSSEVKWPQFILPCTFDSGFAARLMLKDVRIAADLARSLGLPSDLGDQVAALWTRATNDLPDNADHTEIARWLAVKAEVSP